MSHPELEEHLREAVAARRAGRTEDGWRHLIAAEAICRSMGRRRDLVTTLAGMAQLHRDAADFASALPLYEEAVVHAQQLRNPIVLARALRHLGEVHLELRQFERAQQHLRDAIDLYRIGPDAPPLELANAVRPLAICLERQGAVAESRRCWTEAHGLYAGLGIEPGVTECEAGLDRLKHLPD